MLSRARRLHLGAMLLLVAAIAIGCGGQEGESVAEHATDAADAVKEHAAGAADAVKEHGEAAMVQVLAAADAADGSKDKVVAKCGGCKLGMDGSADHALKVKDYEMHFCSADCKSHFAENTEKAVMALKK